MPKLSKVEKIYKELYPSLLLYSIKWVNDEDVAKDIVQNVFIKLLDSKVEILNYKPYLYKSVRNACLNHLKRIDSKSLSLDEVDNYSISYFKDPIEEAEFSAYIFSIISKLPPATQRIFKLNRFEGFSNQEIADKLNISKRTVEIQISNALKLLKKEVYQSSNFYSNYLFLVF
jgi:RNA polymerase sigma-70 factor (ECF subfamily)